MTQQEFFSEITSDAVTAEEKIIRILEARGFLIEEEGGAYYLSDNAAEDDLSYLSEGFDKYSLGNVEPVAKNGLPAQIRISPDAQPDDAIAFFLEQTYISFPVGFFDKPWKMLIRHEFGSKVDVRNLEPFVARYVKAVSACGVDTSFSCDGNHPAGKRLIQIKAHSPFDIWHGLVVKHIVFPRFGIDPANKDGVPFNPNNQFMLYLTLNRAAEYLYQHRKEIREIKKNACSVFTASMMKHLDDSESEKLFVENIEHEFAKRPELTGGRK